MESLREPNEHFDFSKLVLSSPVNINGGNHFIKYNYEKFPLYIKAPSCSIKQGIVTTSKRIFCDLMFTNENSEFIEYIENLEQYSQKYIFQNREKWFETELEENDIENSFNSCMKIYKSGKFYCLRVSVPRILGKSNLKIYDENEQLVEIQNIKENDKVVCALEIQGIKCSAPKFSNRNRSKTNVTYESTEYIRKMYIIEEDPTDKWSRKLKSSTRMMWLRMKSSTRMMWLRMKSSTRMMWLRMKLSTRMMWLRMKSSNRMMKL